MSTFGRCTLTESAYATITGRETRIRVTKETLSEDGLVSTIAVRLQVPKYPIGSGTYSFKCVVYDDDSGYPGALQGVSDVQGLPDDSGKQWVTFNYSPVLNLPAGDYWIGVLADRDKGNYCDVQTTGDTGYDKATTGATYYTTPPTTYPAGGISFPNLIFICCTYTPSANPYPTARLKKGFISGYHCFMSAYILAKIAGYDPLKLPDGTVF